MNNVETVIANISLFIIRPQSIMALLHKGLKG